VYGATPHGVNVLQGLLGVDQIEFLTLEKMLDVEFAIAPVVAILNYQVRITKIGHARDNTIAYLLPVLLDNDPLIPFFAIQVEIKIFNQILSQVVSQERDIVIEFAYLEDLLATFPRLAPQQIPLLLFRIIPAALDIFEDLEADVVRIQRCARWRKHT